MIKHLLFDADGVLFFHTDKMFSERLAEEYGASSDSLQTFFATTFVDCVIGKKDMKEELALKMREWHWLGTVEELMDYWYRYEHDVDEPLISYIRTLKAQGVHASIATNNDHYRAEWLFNHLNLDETVFDKLYAAGDIGAAKPEEYFYEYVIAALDVILPEEILFWDDTPRNVDAARKYGMNAEIYTTYAEFERIMERYV